MNPPTTLTNHNPPATTRCDLNPNPIRREESETPHHHGPAHIPERPPPTITQPPPLLEPPHQHAPQHETQLFATEPDPAAPEATDPETTPARPDNSDTKTTQAGFDSNDSETAQARPSQGDTETTPAGPDSDDPGTTQTRPDRGIGGQWDLPRDDTAIARAGPDRSDAKTTRAGPAAARAALEAARAVPNGTQQTRNQQRPATAR